MTYCTCIFLVIGIMATILGLGVVGAAAVEIAAILFVAEMVYELAIQMISRYRGRRDRPSRPSGRYEVSKERSFIVRNA